MTCNGFADIPLSKAVAGVRVGYLDGRGLVVGPTEQEMEESKLDLVLAGTVDAVLMIEGYCDFLTEEEMLEVAGWSLPLTSSVPGYRRVRTARSGSCSI